MNGQQSLSRITVVFSLLCLVGTFALFVGHDSPAGAKAKKPSKCKGVGGGGPGEGEWGARQVQVKHLKCKAARKLIAKCHNSGKEPGSWTFLSLAPKNQRVKLIKGRASVGWSPVGGAAYCEGNGRFCRRIKQHEGFVKVYARNTSCRSAKRAFRLWGIAGHKPPKERPGANWTCDYRDTDPEAFHPSAVRCERGRSFVQFRFV